MGKLGKFLEPVKRESDVRTENRHRCPSLKRRRRVGLIVLRELGKFAPYLRYKGCLPGDQAGRSDQGALTV